MAYVDVPMYWNRYREDTAAGVVYTPFWQGVEELRRCVVVSRSDEVWIPEMPWMSGYFTFAVWLSIWLAVAVIDPVDAPKSS